MKKTVSNPVGIAKPLSNYSHVVRVEIADTALLFVAGQIASGRSSGVLSPSGKLALMDIFFTDEYAQALASHSLQNVRISCPNFWYCPSVRDVLVQKK